MFAWGIFMSHEARDETIHDDKFHYDLFATEERALNYLKEQEEWWRKLYADPCIVDAAKGVLWWENARRSNPPVQRIC